MEALRLGLGFLIFRTLLGQLKSFIDPSQSVKYTGEKSIIANLVYITKLYTSLKRFNFPHFLALANESGNIGDLIYCEEFWPHFCHFSSQLICTEECQQLPLPSYRCTNH